MKQYVLAVSLTLTALFAFLLTTSAYAQTDVTVTALVPTTVSGSQSSFVADVQTAPADGASRVTLTATLVDSTNSPVPNATVKVTSNRGNVDTILCYDGTTLTSSNTATADTDGIATCVVTSDAPGQVTFSALVDDQLTLDDKPVVTFTALPVLQNLTVTVTLPGGKKITLFQPPKVGTAPTPTPTKGTEPSHTSGSGQLVNTGINVQLSFGTFMTVLALALVIPALFIWILFLLRRQRRLLVTAAAAQAKEQQSLNQIAQTEATLIEKTTAIEEVVDSNHPKPPTTLS